ncbi:MAG TPA: bifunctional precorrin-2 dehydrogenase/sirohydrochlorin ferrochelatase [Solirubrobacterales bacterium]|nr:bifunctional precorrin-2 dehydrogenase/sirohydrochlorin ferrochelatase [Solirubrobacterales bacterium]
MPEWTAVTRYYPIMADLRGRPVLVVGGGPVAQRKVEGLLAADARVTIVSPTLTADLAAIAAEGRVRHEARRYRPGDLAGVSLAFVATGDGRLSGRVADEGRQRGVWVNAADDPAHCDFVLPAVLRRGPLTVSVATDGTSPALAGAVRDALAMVIGEAYGPLAELVAQVRRELRAERRSPNGEAWRRAIDADLLALVAEQRYGDAGRRLRCRLGVG